MDLGKYSEEELLEAGREAVTREQGSRANEFLTAYFESYNDRGEAVPSSGLASYALCLGHSRELTRGLQLCKKAQSADPRNPHIYWCLAQLHLLAGSRKNAIQTVERGLRAAPDDFLLLRMRKKLGVRQSPPLPFLQRDHALNVRLGRLMHRIKGNPAALLPA
jgi:tetratricopeptide (TPR) repeat protein